MTFLISKFKMLVFLALIIITVSCQKKDANRSHVKIQFPNTQNMTLSQFTKLNTSQGGTPVPENWGMAKPTSLSEVQCWMIAVELPELPYGSCVNSNDLVLIRPKILQGPFPSGSSIELDVPKGKNRKFYIMGLKVAANEICKPDHLNRKSLSPPIIVGTKTLDLLNNEEEFSMTVSSNNAIEIDDCEWHKYQYAETKLLPRATIILGTPAAFEVGPEVLRVTLDAIPTAAVTINWETQAGTALASTDFINNNGTIVFESGETQKLLPITLVNDSTYENSESFKVNLTSITNGTFLDSTISVTILDDDGLLSVPTPPTSLTLVNPSQSQGNVSDPLIRVHGVVNGNIVKLYSDSNCSIEKASGTAVSDTINLQPVNLTNGIYNFYAKQTNSVGNSNCSTATVAYRFDNISPGITLTSGASSVVNSSFTVTFTFSEAVSNFTLGDITVGNGTASGLTTSDNIVYTATITPTSDGAVTVQVAASAAQDAALNNNTASNVLSRTYDTTVPTISSVTATNSDNTYGLAQTITIQISFSESVTYSGSVLSLALNSGGSASYSSGSGTSVLSFTYTIGYGEFASDLDYLSTSALSLTGTLRDSATNNANLTLVTVGTSGSISFSKNIVINSPLSLTVQSVYPTNGANWNDYIKFDETNLKDYEQTDEACVGSETGYYGEANGCIHGGEKLKVTVTGYSTCTNLTITDSLAVFDWTCVVVSGTATFFTKSLKSGKGLRDLISGSGGAGSWLNNSVTVQLSASTIGLSSSAAWWSNSITEAPATDTSSTTITSLNSAGTIYYIHTSRQYYLLDITSDKIAFVTLGSAVLYANNNGGGGAGVCDTTTGASSGGTVLSLVCVDNIKHMWLEGSFTGVAGGGFTITSSANMAIKGHGITHSRLNNIVISGLIRSVSHAAINFTSSTSNLITNSEVYATSAGLYLDTFDYNIIRGLKIGDVGGASGGKIINLISTSDYNRFYDLTIMKAVHTTTLAQGISVNGTNNIFQRAMISNIYGNAANSAGIFISGATGGNIFVQVGAFSTQNTGVNFSGASNNIFSHITTANNVWNGFYFTGANSSNYLEFPTKTGQRV